MKYPIKDIKEGVEFVIDDDKTFDELIEFYLPFRHSELSSIDPSKPGDYDSNLNEKFFRYEDSSEIYDWADKVVETYNWRHAIRLYVALATYADKNKADRVLALDIIYCLIGLNNQSSFDHHDKHYVLSDIEIAKQIAIQWGDYEIAKFLAVNALEGCYMLFDLEEYLDDSFWGVLSDLVGVECYFDRISEMSTSEEDKESFFSYGEYTSVISDIIDVAKKSLDYLDDDTLARELYKNTLEVYDITDPEPEYIIEMSKSIAKDLKDKKWAKEVFDSGDRDVILTIIKDSGYVLEYASEELRADKEVVMVAVKNSGYAFKYASEELRADKEVVLAAVKDSGYALEYASKKLQGDKEVVLAAIKNDGGAINYASDELKKELSNNREVEQYL